MHNTFQTVIVDSTPLENFSLTRSIRERTRFDRNNNPKREKRKKKKKKKKGDESRGRIKGLVARMAIVARENSEGKSLIDRWPVVPFTDVNDCAVIIKLLFDFQEASSRQRLHSTTTAITGPFTVTDAENRV